jgi:hypothetical protein
MDGLIKVNFPVISTSNRRAWVAQDLFTNWYTDYFCPRVHRYCGENNYPRRALLLLLLDNAPGNPRKTGKIRTTVVVKAEFLPSNTTYLLQPMDQGIIAKF